MPPEKITRAETRAQRLRESCLRQSLKNAGFRSEKAAPIKKPRALCARARGLFRGRYAIC